jgi:hypothetical protein
VEFDRCHQLRGLWNLERQQGDERQ